MDGLHFFAYAGRAITITCKHTDQDPRQHAPRAHGGQMGIWRLCQLELGPILFVGSFGGRFSLFGGYAGRVVTVACKHTDRAPR